MPAALVAQHVVSPTEEHQIREVGGSAPHPVPDVVRIAPMWRAVAAREHATAVAHHESTARCR